MSNEARERVVCYFNSLSKKEKETFINYDLERERQGKIILIISVAVIIVSILLVI